MGSDLRTSARDLLTLAQKVSTVLQRHSDKLLGEIESGQDSLASGEETLRSELCQQALEVRRQVWESSKSLKNALDHVEDIEDEDEPRILQEPIDELQVHIREGLKIVSDAESKVGGKSNVEAGKTTASESDASQRLPSTNAQTSAGMMAPGMIAPGPSLVGSMNRHPLGLFSTSPQFTVKTSFASPGRMPLPRFTPTATVTSMGSDSGEAALGTLEPLEPQIVPKASSKASISIASRKQPTNSTAIAIDEGPLSVPTSPKVSAQTSRVESGLDSVKSVSLAPSTAAFTTAITSPPLDASLATNAPPESTPNILSREQTDKGEGLAPKKPEQPLGSAHKRRVPRGLFSSASTSGSDSVRAPSFSEGPSVCSNEYPNILEIANVEASVMTSPPLSGISSTGDSPPSSSSQPQSPHSSLTSTLSSPSPSETKNPAGSPPLPRSQPKPSPIQTTSLHNSPRTNINGATSEARRGEDGEEISQLARELERAMNPTPTESVPQIYFLQGKGLLQRIPSHVSMDDGLLDDDEDGQQSEELDRDDAQGSQVDRSDSLQSNGQLRRQRSGGRRQFRISRSRSRNRSKGRQEGRSNPPAAPIEVVYPDELTSSEWPFDRSPPRGRTPVSPSSAQRQRDHVASWQTKAGPHLPFAESVTMGNPIRVGKGIGSFTIYSIALKLCNPAEASPTLEAPIVTSTNVIEGESSGSSQRHAGHASEESAINNAQYSDNNDRRLENNPETSNRDVEVEHHRPYLPKTPSKASLMMTRSFSFPELGSTAERLLMSMQLQDELSPPASVDSACSVPEASKPNTHSSVTTTNTRDGVSPSTKATERIIHVRKRYSDFVILRAQLVEMLRRSSRIRGRGRPMPSQPTSESASRTANGSSYPYGSRNNQDFDDEDIEGDYVVTSSHSRTPSGTSTVNTSLLCRSILRGMPKLPPKKVVGKFRPAFIERRRRELEYFLEWVVAHPVIGDCPVVVQWFLGAT